MGKKHKKFKKATFIIMAIALWLLILTTLIIINRNFKPKNSSLSFGYFTFSNFEDVRRTLISEFSKNKPNVKIKYETGILEEDYSEWLYSKFLKGDEPDIFLIKSKDLSTLISKEMLMDLNGLIKNSKSFNPGVYYNKLLESGSFNKKSYVLPIIVYPQLMYVNKTLLEKTGISFPKKNWTWSDFHLICRKLTYYNLNKDSNQFNYTGYTWLQAAYSNKQQPFSKGGKETNINNIHFINSVNYIYRLNQMNEDNIPTEKDFDKGNVAFMPISTQTYLKYNSYPGKIEKNYNFDYDIISMPAGPNGDNISLEDVLYAGISTKSKNRENSWIFLQNLSSNLIVQGEIINNKIGFPVIKGLLEDQEKKELLSYIIEKGQPIYKFQSYNSLFKYLDEGINSTYTDQNSIALSLKELYLKIDKVVSRKIDNTIIF